MKSSAAIQLNLYQQADIDLEDEFISIPPEDIEEQEMFMLSLDNENKKKIEKLLLDISKDIKLDLTKRIQISTLVTKYISLFHNTSWYDKDDACEKAEEKINDLYLSKDLPDEGIPSSSDVLPGFLNF